jgi:hypothetical protein
MMPILAICAASDSTGRGSGGGLRFPAIDGAGVGRASFNSTQGCCYSLQPIDSLIYNRL